MRRSIVLAALTAMACEDPVIMPKESGVLPAPSGCAKGARPGGFCWAEPVLVQTRARGQLGFDINDFGGTMLSEPDGDWLYFSRTSSASAPGTPRTKHLKMRLVEPDRVDLASLVELETTRYSGGGYSGAMQIARDGLELVFESDRPDARFVDREIYVSARASLASSWPPPAVIEAAGAIAVNDGSAESPVILDDLQSLLYAKTARDESTMNVARRSSRERGSAEFAVSAPFALEPGFRIFSASLSCDGEHLLYMRRVPTQDPTVVHPTEPRVARISSLDPLAIEEGRALDVPGVGTETDDRIFTVREVADGSGIYVSSFQDIYYASRIPCSDE